MTPHMSYEHHSNTVSNSSTLSQLHYSHRKMTGRKPPSPSSQSSVLLSHPVTSLDKRSPQLYSKAPHRSAFSPTFLILKDNCSYKSPSELGPCSHSARSSLEDTREDYQDEHSDLRSRSHTLSSVTVRRALHRDSDKLRFPFPNLTSDQRDSDFTPDTRSDSSPLFDEELGGISPRHPLLNRVNSKGISVIDSLAKSPTKSFRVRGITHRPDSGSSYSSPSSPTRSSAPLRIKPKKIPVPVRRGAITLLKTLTSSSVTEPSPQLLEEVEYDWAVERRQHILVRARLCNEEKTGETALENRASLESDVKTVLVDDLNEKVAIRPKSWELTPEERQEQEDEDRRIFTYLGLSWTNQSYVSAHPRYMVPYPFAYDNVVLQTERHSLNLVKQLFSGRPSVHGGDLVTPPLLVLDLGCGDGSWMIDAVRTWKNTRFYGLDLQNLHPSRQQLAIDLGELANNIKFTYHNFLLHKLPYLDEKFDMVRMANLKWAVPDSKLNFVLEEIHRVLKRGGWVEIIDDDFQLDISPENTLSEEQYNAIRDLEIHYKNMLLSRGLPLNRDSAFMAKKLGERFVSTLDETFPVVVSKGLLSSFDHSSLQPDSQSSHKAAKFMGIKHDTDSDKHRYTSPVRSRSGSVSSGNSYTSAVSNLFGRNGDRSEYRNVNDEQMAMTEQSVGNILVPDRSITLSQAEINIHTTHNMQSILASKEAIRTYILEKSPELRAEMEALRHQEIFSREERQKYRDLLCQWNKQIKDLDDVFWTFESALFKSFNLPQSSFDVDGDDCDDYPKSFTSVRPQFHRSGTGTNSIDATNKSHKSEYSPSFATSLPTSDNVIRTIRVYTGLK